jgi:hypothetical protein
MSDEVVIHLPIGIAPDQNPKEPKFPLIKFSELRTDTSEIAYIVKGIIPNTGLIAVWGPPKCGKSFWVLDLFLHVALDWKYREHKVKQGSIVYCAFEGAAGFGKRADAFREHYGIPPDQEVPFYLSPLRTDLIKDHRALIESISMQLAESEKPTAVVLDTLNRSLVGSESRDEDMSAYVSAADAIREAFQCAVVIVHHCGIDASRPRGHTSLTGAVEAQIKVEKDAASNVIVTVEYMKEGEEGEVIVSRLERTVVGIDPDGDEITSCIVVSGDPAAAKRAERKSSKAANPLRDAINEAFDLAETIVPFSGMTPVPAVRLKDVLAQFERRYVVQPRADESPAKLREAKTAAFNRGIKKLPEADFGTCVSGGEQWIWRK